MACFSINTIYKKLFIISFFTVLSVINIELSHGDERSDQIHKDSVEMARKGNHNSAMTLLKPLTRRYPENNRYLFDYIVILGWAGHDAELLKERHRLKGSEIPVYVLDAIGKSARNLGQYPLAITTYKKIINQNPNLVNIRIALALTLSDAGQHDKALEALNILDKKFPQKINQLEARVYALKNKEDYYSLLAVYQNILRINPSHREASRQLVLLTAKLGAPHLASDMVQKNLELFTPHEIGAILSDKAAITLRWGRLYIPDKTDRYKETDKAISLLKENLNYLTTIGKENERSGNLVKFDLMTAYRDREQMSEVILIYERLISDGADIPAYALVAAADSYLYFEQPESAINLYLEALKKDPDNFGAAMSLFYAYTDNEEYERAKTHIDRLAEKQPEWITEKWPPRRKKNPKKLAAYSTKAVMWAYSNNLEEAQQRLEYLLKKAPYNADIRSRVGYISLWRGWPRKALREFRLVLNEHPDNISAKNGSFKALMTLNEYNQSHDYLKLFETAFFSRKNMNKLKRDWEIYNMRELFVRSSKGFNSGEQVGSQDLYFETYLYSHPFKYSYRAFVHEYYSNATFSNSSINYKRLGAGLEYRARDMQISGELSFGSGQDSNLGASLRSTWMPDDFWSAGISFDTYSNDVPIRGRLFEDLHGWSSGVDLGYRVSELRNFSAALKRSDFSDNNVRTELSASWFERLVSHQKYMLDATLGLFRSENSRDNASYFNPKSDLSMNITLDNEWLLYKRYTRSFRHRFGGTLGNYQQEGFGSSDTWSIRYEHQWNRDDRFELIYGVSRSKPVYDGVSEYSTRIDMQLDWRF